MTNQTGSKKDNLDPSLELSTLENSSPEPSASTLEIKTLIIDSCKNLQNFIDFFESATIKNELQDQSTVLCLKVQIDDSFDELESDNLNELNNKCYNKSIVVTIESDNHEKISIYWKSKEIHELIILKHYGDEFTENERKIYEFIGEYLGRSLSKGQLGLYREWQKFSNGNEVGAHLLADLRDYNLLLIAAELGNSEIVKILLSFGAYTVADDGVSAQDLAWKNRHSEVLVVLAQANLTYPEGIDINQLSDDFKSFYNKTEQLHAAIIEKNEQKVKEILSSDQMLEFYFDLTNKSAARIAVDAKAFDIYEILVINEIFLAPHEYEQGVFDDLEQNEQKIIREIHNKHSKDLPDKHINVLMAHSHISHDDPDAHGKLKYVYEAYKHMSQDSRLNTILKTVAAAKNSRIIYDFNRDAVNIADPTTSDNTEGVFYPMGRIYIGARQLLDDSTRNQAIGTLAHELCHYAVYLVYSNLANPYTKNDNETMQEFEEINEKCQKQKGKELLVDLVHEHYPTNMHHAELIVRPAHMIALYLEQPEKLEESSQTFPELFAFFEKTIIEMEAAIPDIERRDEVEAEKKDQKITNLRKKLVWSVIFSIIGIIGVAAIVALVFYKPVNNFKELSSVDKLKVTNAPIIYKNIEVRFKDLFPDISTAYYKLTSDHLSQIFKEEALNFNDSHFQYLDELIHHDWQNLAEKLKNKFLSSNFTFQNESLKFQKLSEVNPNVFNSLTSEEILSVLDGEELVIGSMIENKTEFYLERKLIYEDIKDGYIFLQFLQNFKNKTIRDLFERYPVYKGFFHGTPYEALTFIENIPVDKFTLQDIYGLIPSISSKIFILSSEAGAGKTVTFEQLAMRIKKSDPVKWVSYIDMKEYVDLFDKFKDAETLLNHILGLNFKNEFERKVFEILYKSGNAVLLWNGFDEISPSYSAYIMDIVSQVHQKTKTIQFISTRPLYSLQLRNKFKTRTFQLIPYSKAQQEEFLRKFFTSKNVNKHKIVQNIQKIKKTIQRLLVGGVTSEAKETTRDFNTPLILKLVAEIYVDNDEVEPDNFYEVYQKFVEKKIGVWQDNSPFVKNIVNKLLSGSSKFNIIEIYHKYALPRELFEALHLQIYFELKKLKVMSRRIPKELSNIEISRMGILYINDDTRYEFAHKTIGEFFTAQYFIENIYNADDDVGPEEAYYRLEIFFYIAQNYGYNQVMVTDFMKSFLDKVNNGGENGLKRIRRNKIKSFENTEMMTRKKRAAHANADAFQNDKNYRLDHKIREVFTQNHGENDYLNYENDTNIEELLEPEIHNDTQIEVLFTTSEPKNLETSSLVNSATSNFELSKPISSEMSKLLQTKFKKFLFDLVNPRYPEILKFMLDFFKKDHDVLLELLNVNEDETLYTATFNPNHFVALVNPLQIKEIVKSYLSDEEFEKFLTGRNQKGKIMLGMIYYELKNKPKIHYEIKIGSDVLRINGSNPQDDSQDVDFYDYADIIAKNLTDYENKQFFLLAITPPFYSAFDTSKIPKHEKLWQKFQHLLSKSEIQSAIADIIHKLIKKYPEFNEFKAPANYLLFLLQKTGELLTNSEIFEMFKKYDIIHIGTYNYLAFGVLWEFVENNFNEDQIKLILQVEDKPHYYRKYDSFHFYHSIPLTILHKASLRYMKDFVSTVMKIYKQRFSTKEIQEILTSSDEFMLEFVTMWKYKSAEIFKTHFGELFENDKESLKKFLYRKMKITKMTVFDYFKDIRGDYYERIQEFNNTIN